MSKFQLTTNGNQIYIYLIVDNKTQFIGQIKYNNHRELRELLKELRALCDYDEKEMHP